MTRLVAATPTGPTIRRRPGHDPGLLSLAVMTATHYLEVRAGRRPVTQLRDQVSDRVRRQLAALVRRQRRSNQLAGALSLRRVWVDRSHDDVVSVVVVLTDGSKMFPVAMTMVSRDDRLVVTNLGTPQDHPPRDLFDPTAHIPSGGRAPQYTQRNAQST